MGSERMRWLKTPRLFNAAIRQNSSLGGGILNPPEESDRSLMVKLYESVRTATCIAFQPDVQTVVKNHHVLQTVGAIRLAEADIAHAYGTEARRYV